MIILAIETSCDETSIAILCNKKVLSNVTISQVLEHSKFGGVVPGLAARLHVKNIQKVFEEAISIAKIDIREVEYIAYTAAPGLVVCLQIGKIIAETISFFLNIPLIACDHLWGHAYSTLINSGEEDWKFPVAALIISGGHTQLWKSEEHGKFTVIGETLDDSIGECIDKTAVIMGEKYPGGELVEKLAREGKPSYKLPFPKNDKSLDFSFSGLKSEIKRIQLKEGKLLNNNNLSASLQETLTKILTRKLFLGLKLVKPRTVVVGGGVIANQTFRTALLQTTKAYDNETKFLVPALGYCGDNAAMIGIVAYYKIVSNRKS